jgi:hypothetical protein
MFDVDEDDATPPSTVGPAPPPPITVHVPVGKWVDGGNKALDPEDLDLLSEIMDIPQEVSSILLPLSDAVNVRRILDFKLPNIDDGSFEQTGASCFDRARPNENLVLPPYIPPKSWVYSLRESLGDAIRDGKRSIIHPQFKDQPLPLWILNLWESLHAVRYANMTWLTANRWIQDKIYASDSGSTHQSGIVYVNARVEMYRLPYHKTLAGRPSTSLKSSLQLARLLSDDAWLSDSIVDMMIQSTIRRLVANQSNLVITDTELAHAICMTTPNFYSLPHAFKTLEQTLAEGKVLFFPAYIPAMSHFVAFRIDFKRKTLCYGRPFR